MFRWCSKKNPDAVKALKIRIKTFLISPALDSEAGFYFLLLAVLRLQDTSSSSSVMNETKNDCSTHNWNFCRGTDLRHSIHSDE